MSPKVSTRLLAAQSDRRLLELVAAGHERAFEVLVQRYRAELLRYCRRLGLSESRSEDAVQQGLLRAWLALERGDEVRELRAWLYRIVHNTAINIMRRAPEDHSPLTDAASVESAAGAEVDLERTIAVRDALTDVAALPPMQREAILLTAVDGRSHDEVASALGITHGAVRGLIYRARATLRGAAAALTPQPLIGWLYGGAAKLTPTAQRIAELSAQGGGGSAPGTIFRGAALAATAVVLIAGAAEVPLHHHATHHAKAPSRPVHLALRSAGAPASSFASADAVVHVTPRKASGHQVGAVSGTQLYANNAQPHSSGHTRTAPKRSAIAPAGGQPVTVGRPATGSTVVQSPPAATVASSTGAVGQEAPSGSSGGQQPGSGGSGSEGTKQPEGTEHKPGSGGEVSDDPPGDGSEGSDDAKEEAEREKTGSGSAVDSTKSATAEPSDG